MWYAIQTMTGSEEEAIENIRKTVDNRIYKDCFLLKREAIWRIQGTCKIHKERLFPGYVFVDTQHPKELYQQLKQVFSYTKILGKDEEEFYPVSREEENFLRELLNGDTEHTVRLSTVVVDESGNITECGEPLKYYCRFIVKKRIRLRYVVIRIHLFERDREILLGIRLEEDRDGT